MDPPTQDGSNLSLSGSRSLLKQLRPKGTSKDLLAQSKRDSSDSSSEDERVKYNTREGATGANDGGSSSSSIGSLDQSAIAPQRQPSPFRSMLRGGGSSGAQALRDRLGRIRKRGSDNDGGRLPRLGGGNRLRGAKAGLRPPVQHADSLSSDEGTKESGSTKEASDDNNILSPGSSRKSFVSSPGGLATSSSDDSSEGFSEKGDLKSPRRWGKGFSKGSGGGAANVNSVSTIAGKNPQASQLRNGLFRLTRQKPRQPSAPRHPVPSDSSSASSTEEEDKDRDHPGTDSSPKSGEVERAPLLDEKLSRQQLPSGRGTRSRLSRSKGHGNNTRGGQRASTGTERNAAGSDSDGEPKSRSSRTDGETFREPRRERILPSWQRLVSGWGRLRDTGEHDMAVVSGVGRPAAGMLENTMYNWFGGVVGRAWPGVGLAPNPVVSDNNAMQVNAHVKQHKIASENDVVRVHVIATDALPEDSRITRPMVVVHIVDSSTGQYLRRTSQQKERTSSAQAAKKGDNLSKLPPERSRHDKEDGVSGVRLGRAGGPRVRQQQLESGMRAGEDVAGVPESARPDLGGATTTFEERTVWNLTDGDKPETGHACGSVPPAATKPWMMTMSSSTPVWQETLVFAESYRRLLSPETVLLFELVDFAASLSRKEARKGGGLSKIAWAFLRPVGASGECNVDVRSGDNSPQPHSPNGTKGCARISRLQLFKHQPLSVLAKWQARQRGFPRLSPPVAPNVPDVFLQFLLFNRTRYPATLAVSVGPTPRPRPVRVARRPMAPHEREGHELSYEALAVMHQQSREDREKDEAAGIFPGGDATEGGGGGGGVGAGATTAARSRRLRPKNEPCVLPDRLLHRVYAGQNGAITLAFSGSGTLLAAACCDDPLPGWFPIRLIDSETGRCRVELKGHASMVYSLVWSPGDSFLLSASADGTAKVWRISDGNDAEGIKKGGFYGAGSAGAPASAEGLPTTARRSGRDEKPRLACVLQHAPPCFVYAAVFQPAEVLDRTRGATLALDHPLRSEASECALVVTGAYDRRLRLWDIAAATAAAAGGRGKMLGTLSSKTVHESHVNAIVYDAKNSRLYSGDGAGVIVVWRRGGGGRGGGGGRAEDYGVLRKVQHADLVGKAITSLALAPRLRRGQLLVQAHGNTLRLLDLGTYQLVNPGFAGGAAAESLIRASFSPDGRFVVSGSEKGQVRVWESQEGKRVRTPLQSLGTACCLRDVAWHPHQHVLALAGYGQDAPVLLYCGEARADKRDKREAESFVSPSSMEEQAAREAHASAEEHRRRLANRQRLRELRIKRLRAKALGLTDGPLANDSTGLGSNRKENGVAAALAALTAAGQKAQYGVANTTAAAPS